MHVITLLTALITLSMSHLCNSHVSSLLSAVCVDLKRKCFFVLFHFLYSVLLSLNLVLCFLLF